MRELAEEGMLQEGGIDAVVPLRQRSLLCDRRASSCLTELSAQCRGEGLVRRMCWCGQCGDHTHRTVRWLDGPCDL